VKLSVIIVNYNVRSFLEQCLHSLIQAMAVVDAECEILVVDNQSTDNSVQYLSERFPAVRFLPQQENLGFARACNLGAREAKAQYLLFLNPDTIIPEDCLQKCLNQLDSDASIGALGVKMLDGSGRFLPESKRAFPHPLAAFFKLSGVSAIFPRSEFFSKYHLGHLSPDETHWVEVLSGAFMILPANRFQSLNGFDEAFFMYGEDIDLSYRVVEAGYKNLYFAETSIIHFKGESTRKGSLNYVLLFYRAMIQFVRKHDRGIGTRFYQAIVRLAIWGRAGLAAAMKFIQWSGWLWFDALLIFASFWLARVFWSMAIRPEVNYPTNTVIRIISIFTILYLFVAYYSGLYDKRYHVRRIVRSAGAATLIVLAVYALLPETIRFSRGMILLGSILSFVLLSLSRQLLKWLPGKATPFRKRASQRIAIAGTLAGFNEVTGLSAFRSNVMTPPIRIAVDTEMKDAVGTFEELPSLCRALLIDEIVYCAGDLSYRQIIQQLSTIPSGISCLIHYRGSDSMVGSSSPDSAGSSFNLMESFRLADPFYLRLKRLIDILLSLIMIVLSPLLAPFTKKPAQLLTETANVLIGRKTWIGYNNTSSELPNIRPAVIPCTGYRIGKQPQLPSSSLQTADRWYARDYEPLKDIAIVSRNYRNIGT